MKILLIDGQGGKLGAALAEKLLARFPSATLVAVGTNSIATSAMIRAGAKLAATGENAVIVNCRDADVVVGPIGIVMADAMLGEITPAMAAAVAQSRAGKVLIPANRCRQYVAGVGDAPLSSLIDDAVEKVGELAAGA